MSLSLISAIIEQDIIAQYEEEELFTEKVITAAIDCLTTDDIICPLCLKYDHFFICYNNLFIIEIISVRTPILSIVLVVYQ